MGRYFFLKYGGPETWLTQRQNQENHLIHACQEYYIGGKMLYHKKTYAINGIQATVHSFGIHKTVCVELPENPPPSSESITLFEKALRLADTLSNKEYEILNHNCVSAVAQVLHLLDPNSTPPTVTMPWKLDKHLNRYCGYYCQESTEGRFIQKYQAKVFDEHSDDVYWSQKRLSSLRKLISVAYAPQRDERTKASLLELGWITESKSGILEPTNKAPHDFQEGLRHYNQERQLISAVMKIHLKHDPSTREISFFRGNPSLNELKDRMQQIVKKDPYSPCTKTLTELEQLEKHSTQTPGL